jgi:LCP family protein required for cell wall assembly
MIGVVSGKSPAANPATGHKSEKTQSAPTVRVGNFRATDGFHPNKQSQIQSSGRITGRQPVRKDDGTIELQSPENIGKKRRQHSKHRGKTIAMRGASMFMVFVLLMSGFVFGKAYLKFGQIFKGGGSAAALGENVDPALLKGEGDGRVNILLLGKGGPGHEAPDLTDTILIASINPIQKEAALLSIPRDFYVKTEDYGSMKINAVYANRKNDVLSSTKYNDPDREKKAEEEGIKAIENTITKTVGIPIHYHGMVDFQGFKKAIDTVDGVDVNAPAEVQETMWIDGRNYRLNVQPGVSHFDGFRALAYSRSRHTSPRGDFDRSERQRLMLVALKDKILSLGTLSNPLKINQLISDFGDHIETNLSVNEMMRLYDIGKEIPSDKIQSVGLADPPNDYVTTSMIGGQSVVIPKAGVGNYKDIQNFVRNKLRDGYLADENATVMVLNGTNVPGLAGRTADELKSFGYNMLPAADAPTKSYQETVIVDLRNGDKKYTKHYLENRFGVSTVPNLPDSSINPGMADFVIIIGQNEVSRLQN